MTGRLRQQKDFTAMLKYTSAEVTFAEVPDEITLCINISNCPCHCKGCHSPYLAEDIGEPLTEEALSKLIERNTGITCVSFMGGDSDPHAIEDLAFFVKEKYRLKVAWYSGRDNIFIDLTDIDFVKTGPYKEEFGPLNKDTTNQVFYKVVHMSTGKSKLYDITYKFWKND